MKPRINFFSQMTTFYSKVWHEDNDFTASHISLYFFLVNQNNRNNWAEWFKVPLDLGLKGSCIGSKKTYYATMEDLQKFGLIKYERGINEWKAPKVSLIPLVDKGLLVPIMEVVEVQNVTSTVTSSVTSTVTANDSSRGTQPIPLGVRDIDNKTIDKKTTRQEIAPLVIPQNLLRIPMWEETWGNFCKHRGAKKFTELAKSLAIKKLATFRDPIGAMENSIVNGWSGLFDPKEEKPKVKHWSEETADEAVERLMRGG